MAKHPSNKFDKAAIKIEAMNCGFDLCRFTAASLPAEIGQQLGAFIDAERHGQMTWLSETLERRKSPQAMWPEAKTAIMLAMNYGPQINPLDQLEKTEHAAISVYAQNRDYHDIIKGKLKILAGKIAAGNQSDVKVFVDTAPLMEKPLSANAGIGWQGKHTNLVSQQFGSWLFLGAILTDQHFEPDEPEIDHCGSCRSCLDICPTKAFPKPYQLDARRCISYLTIEHHGPIPFKFRKAMGNRIYGCDDCLAICPWNKFASIASEAKLQARSDLISPDLAELVRLNDADFRKLFSGSPVKRIGRNRFIRNVLIAIGNSEAEHLAKCAAELLDDPAPEVRGAAIWAFSNLATSDHIHAMYNSYIDKETDPDVLQEWRQAAQLS